MPLQSAIVFASHIGHTGKTTLSFQISNYYARRHPELSILVMDLAEEGDLTKRLLGGVDAAAKVRDVCGSVFELLSDADRRSTGITSWLWSSEVDITQHAQRAQEHNPAIAENLFLISSGAWPRTEQPMDQEKRLRVCGKIRTSLENSKSTWMVFCDTDGDRRPSPFTMLGYCLCQHAIVPLHLNKADLDRTETMLGVMDQLRTSGEISTQVLFIVWNFVKLLKDEPCEHKGKQLPFTPTKVSLDILDACNRRLASISRDLPGLFVHDEANEKDFIDASSVALKVLADNVLKPSEELGLPFVDMVDKLAASGKKTMKFKTGEVEYDAKETVIMGVDESMREIERKLEAMSLSGSVALSK